MASAPLPSWRARAPAVLPLVLLQGIANTCAAFPTFSLFRKIECDAHTLREPVHIPEQGSCSNIDVINRFTTDIAIYTGVAAFFGIVVAGLYGRISDFKGRRKAMGIAAVIQLLSSLWCLLAASVPSLRTIPSFMVAAVLQGLGGSSLVINAAQLAFIADSSPTTTRSFYLGLVVVATTIGTSVVPFSALPLMSNGKFVVSFGVANVSWLVYLLYLTFVLRETRFPDPLLTTPRDVVQPSGVSGSQVDPATPPTIAPISWTTRSIFSSVIEPIQLVFSDSTLRWLGVIAFLMPLTERLFGISAAHVIVTGIRSDLALAYIIMAAGTISIGVTLLFILPTFTALYRWHFSRSDIKFTPITVHLTPTERTPLLSDEGEVTAGAGPALQAPPVEESTTLLSASQDLVLARVSLFIDAISAVWISAVGSITGLVVVFVFYGLGQPANPALQSLLTLAALPSELGRVFTGIAIINSLAGIPFAPFLLHFWNISTETIPAYVPYIVAGLYLCCGGIVALLQTSRFIGAKTNK